MSHLRLIDYGLRRYEGEQDVDWPAVDYAPMAGLPMLTVPAMRSPLGNEPTLDAYIGHLVLCLREWRRVLRENGIVFVNLGDSYANDDKWGGATGGKHAKGLHGTAARRERTHTGLKSKDLMLVPARFALAAQADGWWLRSDIIGAKVAPMPESVTDRPTRSHEHIFMLTKAARYFWDSEAVKEASVDPEGSARRYEIPFHVGAKEVSGNGRPGNAANTPGMKVFTGTRNMRDVIEWREPMYRLRSDLTPEQRAYVLGRIAACKEN